MTNLDIANCRKQRPSTRMEYLGRFIWAIVLPLFKYSPKPFYAWRRFLLRLFGARIGKQAHIDPSVRIYLPWKLDLGDEASIGEMALIYNLGLITIGDRATISQRAHLCAGTHDYSNPSMPLLRLPIIIEAQAWICADVFIGPNIKIGESAVVGAASVVVKDVPPWQIFSGNPAKFVKKRIMKK